MGCGNLAKPSSRFASGIIGVGLDIASTFPEYLSKLVALGTRLSCPLTRGKRRGTLPRPLCYCFLSPPARWTCYFRSFSPSLKCVPSPETASALLRPKGIVVDVRLAVDLTDQLPPLCIKRASWAFFDDHTSDYASKMAVLKMMMPTTANIVSVFGAENNVTKITRHRTSKSAFIDGYVPTYVCQPHKSVQYVLVYRGKKSRFLQGLDVF